jgi:cytochrome c-type biogenesis protein CcmH/NrfG
MLVGYAATEQRDYQTALINFRRALQLRPGNPYATRAISNVQSYIQRSR